MAALFTIAETWKQHACTHTHSHIHTHTHTHTHTLEYYSAINRNEIMPFASTWMQLQTIILSKVGQKERDKYHILSLTCGI